MQNNARHAQASRAFRFCGGDHRGASRPTKATDLTEQQRRRYDPRSAAAKLYRSWYKTAAWRAIRLHQLAIEPFCRNCRARGVLVQSEVCDHVERHRGNREKFFAGPFQSLCKACHDGVKQAEEARGYEIGCTEDGRPRDPQHPWNSPRSRPEPGGGSKV